MLRNYLYGCTIEVYEWIHYVTPHFIMDVITYPWCDVILVRIRASDQFKTLRAHLNAAEIGIWTSSYTTPY